MYKSTKLMVSVLFAGLFVASSFAYGQQKPKLRQVKIALPSQTIGATHYYVGKSLGLYEQHGIELQILVLEPRAALAALMTGDLDFYTATGTSTRAALRNVPIRVTLVGLNRPDHVLVAAKEIANVDQLRGKVIAGYTGNATVNVVLMELMRRKGVKPEEYKILNVGTARFAALTAGNVPAAVLNGLETTRAMKQGFRPLARAAEVIELSTGGLCTSIANLQSKRELYRTMIQATLESIRMVSTQKERVLPVLMKQFAIPSEEASFIYDNVHAGWALDGKPTAAATKFEFELAQKEMNLKEAPKPEQVYDFSLLDEVGRR